MGGIYLEVGECIKALGQLIIFFLILDILPTT